MDSPDPAITDAGDAPSPGTAPLTRDVVPAGDDGAAGDGATTGVAVPPGVAPPPRPAGEEGPIWRFLISRKWLLWHVTAVAGVWGMLWAGDWQYHRALGGNGLSWAYVVEWPMFACFGVVFWAKTVRDEFRIRRAGLDPNLDITGAEHAVQLPAGLGTEQAGTFLPLPGAPGWTGADGTEPVLLSAWRASLARVAAEDWDDPELAAYNKYLAKLNAKKK
jgi:hypothetical protein